MPPVEFDEAAGAETGQEIGVTERGDEERVVGGGEVAEGKFVAVIVVVVTEQHDVDAREGVESESGGVDATRAGPAHRTGARGENGVGEEIAVGGLEEVGRVAEPGGNNFVSARGGWRWRRWIERDVRGPGGGARGEFPAEEIQGWADDGVARVEKSFPVEVVRGRRCHRGVAAIMNAKISAAQTTWTGGAEEIPCA